MIYSPKGLMRYNDSNAIVDDMPLLSQWIKKSRSEERDFLAAELGFEPRQTESESAVLPLHNSAIFLTTDIIITDFFKMSSLF